MKWVCALVQRRLPDYPDGDLTPFGKRRVAAHLAVCPDCRREWEELKEVVNLYESHPLSEPAPAFWEEFNRELHLKLARVNQAPSPEPRRFRLPQYVLGAAALAGIVTVAVYLAPLAGISPAPRVAQRQEGAPAPVAAVPPAAPEGLKMRSMSPVPPAPVAKEAAPAAPALLAKPEAAPAAESDYSLAAGKTGAARESRPEKNGLWPDDDFLSWDVDAAVADLSRPERETLKKTLESRE